MKSHLPSLPSMPAAPYPEPVRIEHGWPPPDTTQIAPLPRPDRYLCGCRYTRLASSSSSLLLSPSPLALRAYAGRRMRNFPRFSYPYILRAPYERDLCGRLASMHFRKRLITSQLLCLSFSLSLRRIFSDYLFSRIDVYASLEGPDDLNICHPH